VGAAPRDSRTGPEPTGCSRRCRPRRPPTAPGRASRPRPAPPPAGRRPVGRAGWHTGRRL